MRNEKLLKNQRGERKGPEKESKDEEAGRDAHPRKQWFMVEA
jgi:hypothetical protein